MNILKTVRKPYVAILMASLILFVSCNGSELIQHNEVESLENFKFDFSLYENNKGNLIGLESFKFNNKSSLSRLEINNIILDEINNQLGTDLNYGDSFKSLELTSSDNVENYFISNNLINETEKLILNDFHLNLNNLELYDAINILEEDVNNANLDATKKGKFEYLANVVQLIEYETSGFFSSTTHQKSCLSAVIGLVFAFAGLAAGCNPAVAAATLGWGCYIAAANYIRASIIVGLECGDE